MRFADSLTAWPDFQRAQTNPFIFLSLNVNFESYEIIISDDPEVDDINEGMFAEIWFKGVQIAEIIEPHPYEVVIYPLKNVGTRVMPLSLLQKALEDAEAKLKSLRPDKAK